MSYKCENILEERDRINQIIESLGPFFQACEIAEMDGKLDYERSYYRRALKDNPEEFNYYEIIDKRCFDKPKDRVVFAKDDIQSMNENKIKVEARKAQLSDEEMEVLEKAETAFHFSNEYDWEFDSVDTIGISSMHDKDSNEIGATKGRIEEIMDLDETLECTFNYLGHL
jgi:hypothetical protein